MLKSFFFFFFTNKTFWEGLPAFAQSTIYHVRTEMRQSLDKSHYLSKGSEGAVTVLLKR